MFVRRPKIAVKSLQVLYLGYILRNDKGDITLQKDKGRIITPVSLSYLVRTDEGNILVDTGCSPRDAVKFSSWTGIKLTPNPEDELPNRLKEVGLTLKDIDTVIVSHFHFDHIGWLSELTHARIVCPENGAPVRAGSALY
jgi:N-acyl homoserine lactone hydrolase